VAIEVRAAFTATGLNTHDTVTLTCHVSNMKDPRDRWAMPSHCYTLRLSQGCISLLGPFSDLPPSTIHIKLLPPLSKEAA
jgi:hypothetical protein